MARTQLLKRERIKLLLEQIEILRGASNQILDKTKDIYSVDASAIPIDLFHAIASMECALFCVDKNLKELKPIGKSK